MKTYVKITLISLGLITLLLAAGCSANQQAAIPETTIAASSTAVATNIKAAPAVTATTKPTSKPTAKPSSTPIETELTEPTLSSVEPPAGSSTSTTIATLTETPTATPVKIADWSSAEFYTGGALAHWQYFIALQFDGNITGEYYAVVDKNKDYKCTILTLYPNRLYCDGPQAAFMDFVKFEVFDAKTDEKVYEEQIWIPGTYYSEYVD
jgi:hypothetical protein